MVAWVAALVTIGLIIHSCDLVAYRMVISTFLRDPPHNGNMTPAVAGMRAATSRPVAPRCSLAPALLKTERIDALRFPEAWA